MDIDYDVLGSTIRHYFGGDNVTRLIEQDTNYFRLWSGYEKKSEKEYGYKETILYQEAVRGDRPDIYSQFGAIADENIDIRMLQQYIDRTILQSGEIHNFIGSPSPGTEQGYLMDGEVALDRITEKNSLRVPTPLYGYFDVPSKNSHELGRKSREKENLYCLHHAIYKCGQVQEQKQTYGKTKFPITIKVYPKKIKGLMTALANEIHGKENISSTNGKDFEYLSVVDKFGRGEIMIFADTEEMLVPTTNQMFCFETKIRDHIIHQQQRYPEQDLKNELRDIQNKDFEKMGYSFIDMSYGMRIVATAIKSIQDNKISILNDAIPLHSISTIIKKYPILIEMANNEEILYQNIDKLNVIAKVIQAEYDKINYMKIARKRFNTLSEVHNFQYSETFLNMNLTEEEKIIYNEIMEQSKNKSVAIPPREDTIQKKVSDLRKDWMETFIKIKVEELEKVSAESQDIGKLISKIKDNNSLNISIGKLKRFGLDFSKVNKELYGKETVFLKYLMDIDIKNIEPTNIFNIILDDIDISKYSPNSLKHIKALVFSEVSKFKKTTKNMTYSGDIMHEYNELAKNLFIVKMCANNQDIMSKDCKFDISDYDIPLEYYDFSKLYQKMEGAYAEGKNIYDEIALLYHQNPNDLMEFTLNTHQTSEICEFIAKINEKNISEKDIEPYINEIASQFKNSRDISVLIQEYLSTEDKKQKLATLIGLLIEEYDYAKQYSETEQQFHKR